MSSATSASARSSASLSGWVRDKVPVSCYIIKDSSKLKASDAEMVVNIHDASEKFAELVLLESNVDVETLKERLEDEYLEIPTDSVKHAFADLDGVWKLKPVS